MKKINFNKNWEFTFENALDAFNTFGFDKYSDSAKEKIRAACGDVETEVYLLTGGTQTNQTVIDSMLQSYEGVIAADTGHVSLHEAGAIEYTGHKVLEIEQENGKICAEALRAYLETFHGDENHEHMVFPGMVYISHPTEYGTLYSKSELEELSNICGKYEIPLYMDGARLGYGLMSEENDMTIEDVAKNCDVFYIGGTKVGALFGEAVVITNKALQEDFRYIIKQKGGMLAKGRLLGIQFLELFKDGLYFEVSAHAMRLAKILKEGLEDAGYKFYANSPTNQLFVIVSNKKLEQISEKYSYEYQMPYDETNSVVRFCTSWATKEENVLALLEDMR